MIFWLDGGARNRQCHFTPPLTKRLLSFAPEKHSDRCKPIRSRQAIVAKSLGCHQQRINSDL